MLQLKRLEIQGFKSFADRTELRFRGTGFTAVVGPNGCGKSNLADAISWVLGEQSAKSLRGSRMEDVIFAGTRDRKPLGMASVTMALVDPRPAPPVEVIHMDTKPEAPVEAADATAQTPAEPPRQHINGNVQNIAQVPKRKEVTITRRLYRSGESEYLIDGKQARLRDIQDIFMGTGLGPESYAIIEQGRITQILSNKPMERRAVIEEAAGVSKFKSRRRLAEAKLEGAKQNLSRVFDILEEVGRQVNSLKRQAAKAKRYEELKTEMVGFLRRALAGRFKVREREAAKAALDLNEANREFQELSAAVAEKEKNQAALQEQCFTLEHELTGKRRELSELRVEAERAKGKIESQSNQVASIEKRLTQGETETAELEKRATSMEAEFQSHADRLTEFNQQYEELRQRLARKTEERDQRQSDLRQREAALESGRQQVLRLLGESSTLKNQLAQVSEYLSGLDRESGRAQREEQNCVNDLNRLEGLKEELAVKVSSRQLELTSIADQRRGVDEELQTHKARSSETRRTLESLRADLSRLRARRDSTQEILSHRSYTTESVKRLFTAIEKGKAPELKPLGVLADFMEVDPVWEKATEEFLHEELEYVVMRNWEEATRGVDLMRKDLDGRATFLVHPEPDANIVGVVPPEPGIGPETGIVGRLSAQLKMTNGLTKAPAELIPRLARCFLVADRENAQRLSLQYPDLFFLMPDGVSFHGHAVSGGRKTGAGPLALKRELRELTKLHDEKNTQVEKTTRLLADLDQQIALFAEEMERLRSLQQIQEKDALALEHEMRKFGEEMSRTNQRMSVVRLELQRLTNDGAKARERQDAMQVRLEQAETNRTSQEQVLEKARAELTDLQQQNAALSEEHAVLRAELVAVEERRRAEQTARARLDQQIREVNTRKQDIIQELQRIGVDRARLLSDNMEVDAMLAEFNAEIAKLEQAVKLLEEQELQARGGLALVEESLRTQRASLSTLQESRGHIEVALVKLQTELQYMEETCQKELGCPLQEVAAADETVPEEEALVEAETRYREVRTRIDNLGPVNPQALEEFQEAQQRYDFLNTQRQDLLDSIRDTEKVIAEIDVESRKRFNEAFLAINENFKKMYAILFHGGSGEMRLTDPENNLDSGIDILASPPGKRLQNVLLLSGGERSLTAMALLLAIFQYQPSPFCVLDEVDAALDEANTSRLVKLLKEMSDDTQFIIVTHAKRTMEASESMYGVTMQEPGVSKIVSVKFNAGVMMPPPPAKAFTMAAGAD
ncbi:MAG: chromosome segregation protein SMC [Acidobacteria bacterium]|nr:chromosome segregation protein SMC [Acidobacteriota bacterium]